MTESLPRTYWCHRGYRYTVRGARCAVSIAPAGTSAPYPGLAVDWMRESVRAALPGLGRESFGTAWAWLGDHRALEVAVQELRRGRPYEFVAQTVHAQEVRIGPDGYRLLPNVMRYAFPSELDLMAQLAGLCLERRTANWDDSPFTTTSTHHVSLYSHQPADRAAPPRAGDTA